ncbi:MAG: bis(5'-nucleosyl)-tetraphosphatase (symmetrical) YqeK [Firmicutes bacterium]|nr:bis(5'-nucleosyl)-tetraphosphatase (symmetrical) YqeK [Bacillota bacterium]
MNSTDKHEELVNRCLERIGRDLKERRVEHTKNVAKEALRLAEKYGADKQKAEIAALLHDIARNLPEEEMNAYVRELNLDEHYLNNKNLAHSKVAAYLIRRDFGITDEEILNAVLYHTTGRENMTLLEKIIFLADAIEPGRTYPAVNELRALAYEDLNRACAFSLSKTIQYVESRGAYLDPDTANALEYFKREINQYE